MDIKKCIEDEMKRMEVDESKYNKVLDIVVRNCEVNEEIKDSIEESVDKLKI